jgi:hypothetical protein
MPLEQRRDVEDVVVDVGVQVAELGEPRRHRVDREVARVASSTSSQRIGRGDPGVGHAAHGVRRGDGVVAGVLVVVDEQLRRVAVLAPPGVVTSSGARRSTSRANASAPGVRPCEAVVGRIRT